eukprot:TRINITY_DN18780_c1_g1_i1.p3 TRINITY_DN18780_c1_g1~~TRINITY_DN18780_c1_g1_i1.p3  ORF type:complete len:204 (+),score=11.10 TRINITY_DN18780_c1_g1_i1:557-1168(+)
MSNLCVCFRRLLCLLYIRLEEKLFSLVASMQLLPSTPLDFQQLYLYYPLPFCVQFQSSFFCCFFRQKLTTINALETSKRIKNKNKNKQQLLLWIFQNACELNLDFEQFGFVYKKQSFRILSVNFDFCRFGGLQGVIKLIILRFGEWFSIVVGWTLMIQQRRWVLVCFVLVWKSILRCVTNIESNEKKKKKKNCCKGYFKMLES